MCMPIDPFPFLPPTSLSFSFANSLIYYFTWLATWVHHNLTQPQYRRSPWLRGRSAGYLDRSADRYRLAQRLTSVQYFAFTSTRFRLRRRGLRILWRQFGKQDLTTCPYPRCGTSSGSSPEQCRGAPNRVHLPRPWGPVGEEGTCILRYTDFEQGRPSILYLHLHLRHSLYGHSS